VKTTVSNVMHYGQESTAYSQPCAFVACFVGPEACVCVMVSVWLVEDHMSGAFLGAGIVVSHSGICLRSQSGRVRLRATKYQVRLAVSIAKARSRI
jgi:hypothetical protein